MLSKCTMKRWSLSQVFRETQLGVDCAAFPKKTKAPKPSNPNFATERSKVMIGRYPPGDSSVSHPQPNLHYSTVDLPLHPRGCLLRACEAQWTEFQWVDSFFCLSLRTFRVRRLASALHEYTVTAWHKQKCWGASFSPLVFLHLTLVFHSLSTASLSTLFPLARAFVPLSLLPSLWTIFPFLPSFALYKEEGCAPIGWLVSLSQRCHYWNPTGLMLIYTHRWAPKQC